MKDPHVNFRNSFETVTNNGNDIVNALVSINFSYLGYANAFNVVAEIKVRVLVLDASSHLSIAESAPNAEARSSHFTHNCFHPIHLSKCCLFRCGTSQGDA